MFILPQCADEPEGDGGEEQGVRRGSDRLGSQYLVAGNYKEHPGVDAAGKESTKCSFLSLLSSPRPPLSLWDHVSCRLTRTHPIVLPSTVPHGHLLFVHFAPADGGSKQDPHARVLLRLLHFSACPFRRDPCALRGTWAHSVCT